MNEPAWSRRAPETVPEAYRSPGFTQAPLAVRCANCCAGVQYSPANGGRDTSVPFQYTASRMSYPVRSPARYGSTGGSWTGAATRAADSASSGTTHGDTDVANDLPRNGPSGWYSQAWMSRADQSLTSTTPKTWSAKSFVDSGTPGSDPGPTTNPTSASMSSRWDGPWTGASASGGLRCPLGRTTSVPDTTTVPARPWYPIGRCFQFGSSGGCPGRNSLPRLVACSSDE